MQIAHSVSVSVAPGGGARKGATIVCCWSLVADVEAADGLLYPTTCVASKGDRGTCRTCRGGVIGRGVNPCDDTERCEVLAGDDKLAYEDGENGTCRLKLYLPSSSSPM